MTSPSSFPVRVLGRYALYGEIASGGMATVHLGRMAGVVGFSKTVAIKRLHAQFAKDPEFVSMFLDEARLAARIQHPNVVSTLDVVALEGELFLVMEYIQGDSLGRLVRAARKQGTRVPPEVVATILVGTLHGLHAAHEATNERREPLNIVHRDVSPQNIMVGMDGVPRVLDFGVAKASGRATETRNGSVKGKLAYMAPEQLVGNVTRKTDVYAASVVLWEALTCERLFAADSEGETLHRVLDGTVDPPSSRVPGLPAELDAIVLRGMARDAAQRFDTARDMARAIEKVVRLAPASEVGEYVSALAGPSLAERAGRVAKIESSSLSMHVDANGRPVIDPPPPRASSEAELTLVEARPSEPSTQLSAASNAELSSMVPFARRAQMRRLVGVVAAGASALVLVAAGVWLGARRGVRGEGMARAGVVATAPERPLEVPLAVAPESPPAEAPLAAPPVASEASPPTPSAPSSGNGSARSVARPPARKPAPSCDPPYVVDAQGFRHYKRECE